MPLDVPDGAACFLDANILYYALVPTPDVYFDAVPGVKIWKPR